MILTLNLENIIPIVCATLQKILPKTCRVLVTALMLTVDVLMDLFSKIINQKPEQINSSECSFLSNSFYSFTRMIRIDLP